MGAITKFSKKQHSNIKLESVPFASWII